MHKYSGLKSEPAEAISSILKTVSKFSFLIGVMNNSNILVSKVFEKIIVYNITTREFLVYKKDPPKNVHAIPFVSFECKTNERFFFLKGELTLNEEVLTEGSFRSSLLSGLDALFDGSIIDPKSIKKESMFYTSKKEPILDALNRL